MLRIRAKNNRKKHQKSGIQKRPIKRSIKIGGFLGDLASKKSPRKTTHIGGRKNAHHNLSKKNAGNIIVFLGDLAPKNYRHNEWPKNCLRNNRRNWSQKCTMRGVSSARFSFGLSFVMFPRLVYWRLLFLKWLPVFDKNLTKLKNTRTCESCLCRYVYGSRTTTNGRSRTMRIRTQKPVNF